MIMRTAIVLLTLFGVAPYAFAADPPPPDARLYSLADFPDLPAQADMEKLYPERAREDEVEGTVTLNCQAGESGRFIHCAVVSETPQGYGFGEASAAWFLATLQVTYPPGSWNRFTVKWSS